MVGHGLGIVVVMDTGTDVAKDRLALIFLQWPR